MLAFVSHLKIKGETTIGSGLQSFILKMEEEKHKATGYRVGTDFQVSSSMQSSLSLSPERHIVTSYG